MAGHDKKFNAWSFFTMMMVKTGEIFLEGERCW